MTGEDLAEVRVRDLDERGAGSVQVLEFVRLGLKVRSRPARSESRTFGSVEGAAGDRSPYSNTVINVKKKRVPVSVNLAF